MKTSWITGIFLLPLLLQAQVDRLSLYQISPQEIKQILTTKKYEFDVYSLSNPVKVIATKQIAYTRHFNDSIPKGYYLLSSLVDRQERFFYYHHTDFGTLQIKTLGEERYLHIPNERFPADSLRVSTDGEPLTFAADLGLFRLGERSKSGVLSISSPEETIHLLWERNGQKEYLISEVNAVSKQASFSSHRQKEKEWKGWLGIGLKKWYLRETSQGYLALNQPIYRPGDSLKLKAYILDAEGKGLNQSLSLCIYPSGDPAETQTWSKLAPNPAGVYLFQTILGDSLRLDRNYILCLKDDSEQIIVQNQFKLEDYLLDEFVFSFYREPSYDLLTDSSSFIFKARTENDLPVPGVRVFLTAQLTRIQKAGQESLYAPLQLLDTLIELPPSGFYRLALPPTRFPKLESSFVFSARFVGANGEQSTRTAFLTRYDSLPKVSNSSLNLQANALPQLQYDGRQQKDSAFFHLHNPQKQAFIYRIYRQHNLLAEGVAHDSLSWQWPQAKEAFWRMEIQDLGGSYTRKLSLAPGEHFLHIELQQPDTIKPGQKVNAVVKVTDNQGRPVPNTDLTVWGVNAQFPKENVPELPYLGPKMISSTSKASLSTDAPQSSDFNRSASLSPDRAEQLGLMTKDYYQFYFPDSIVLQYHPIADTSVAMYAPFVFDSLGRQQKVHFIWQDSVIKYYDRANPENPYCILSKNEGAVTLDLRLQGELLHLPKVLLKKGYKLELSVNQNRLPHTASQEIRPWRMTMEEADIVNRYFPQFSPGVKGVAYLWQRGWTYPISIDSDYAYRSGPFSSDSIYILYPGHFGRKIDWKYSYQHQARKWEVIIDEIEPTKVGQRFDTNLQNQKLGQYTQSLDSLDFSTPEMSQLYGIPDLYDVEPFYPYRQSPQVGFKVFHPEEKADRPLFLVLQTYTDTLNQYVQSVNSNTSSWLLAPDHYRLQAYFADSLCVQYDSLLIKADSIWVWDLDQLQGDTLAKKHWKSLKELKSNTEYHQAWSEPVKINYSSDNLGKYRMRFRLVDTFGAAVSGVKVWTQENRNSRRLQISDAQGWVEFTHMNSATPRMSLYHPDFRYGKLEYEEDSVYFLTPMPEEHLTKWQAALNAPHKIKNNYNTNKYLSLSYLDAPAAYIPSPSLFFQDTINPVLRQFSLDKQMLPLAKTAPNPVEVEGGFPSFWLPELGTQWGISSTWGLARMSGILDYERGAFGDLGLWYQFRPKLRISLLAGLESQYASAQRDPAIIQNHSLWEEWYEAGAAIYPAIRRDRWSSALQLQFAPLQNAKWRLELGLGAGLMGGRLLVDARRDAQLYDYQEIFALDQGSPPLSNPDRTDMLRGIRDENYETIYPLQRQIAPYALTSAQISYNLAPRLQIYASYQFQVSGRNTWDTEIGSYTPLSQGAGPTPIRRWHQQWGIGLSLKLSRGVESLWWINPVTGIYSDIADTRKLVNSLTEDSDGDGVPDLYDKEPDTPKGKMVNPSGRALDSDRDGMPDTEDAEYILLGDIYKPRESKLLYLTADSLAGTDLLVKDELSTILASLRQDFRDAAFWESNLRTDANGEAHFTIQYPDDITAWHCYVLAMNENRQSGYLKDTVKAQAPLFARLDLPQTLRVGDQLDVVGRVQSLADSSQEIYTRFMLGDSLLEERSVTLEEAWQESQRISFPDTGTYKIAYLLRDSSGFTEGELRELAVIDNKVMEQKGSFVYLEGDSSISMPSGFAASQNVRLIAYHQPLDLLQERLDWLYRYPYGCNEQLASRLIGLHLQQLLTSDPTILKRLKQKQGQTLRQLLKSQNDNGSWGWWSGNQAEEWMSLYVLQALQTVSPQEKAIPSGQAWLVQAFREAVKKEETPSLKLALYLLQNQLIAKEDYQLPPVDSFARPLGVFDQLLRLAIQYEQGEKLAVSEILGLAKRDALGGRYWSERGWRWYGSQIECTALAYELIAKTAPDHAALSQIRQFLLLADYAWQNQTVETVRMLQILIQEQDLENALALQSSPKLQLSYAGDSRLYDDFPLELDVPPTGVSIRKQGAGPLLLSFSQTQALVNAPKVDSLFEIKTSLKQSGQVLDSLVKSGQLELVVEVVVKYRTDHLMLEVPIPAGCTYSDKPQPYGEAYREYRRDRTNIYLRSLAPGKYTYRIPLESRFTGDFQLQAARMELMYVPTQFGRNTSKRVKIID